MATYEVKGPDGAIYEVEGPDGATDDQLISAVKNQINQETTKEEPFVPPPQIEETTFSDIAQGVGSGLVRGLVVEPTKTVFNLMGNSERADKVEKSFNKFQEYTGLTPESGGGQIAERLSGFLGSFLLFLDLLLRVLFYFPF